MTEYEEFLQFASQHGGEAEIVRNSGCQGLRKGQRNIVVRATHGTERIEAAWIGPEEKPAVETIWYCKQGEFPVSTGPTVKNIRSVKRSYIDRTVA